MRHGVEATPAEQSEPPEWEYLPEGWDAQQSRDGASGWMAQEVAETYAEQWPQFLAAIEGAGPLGVWLFPLKGQTITREDPHAQNGVLTYTYAIQRAGRTRERLSVLDWGGALGHYHNLARKLAPELELDYHCREMPAICEVGRQLNPDVTFHATDACLSRSYDLVFASNSLQFEHEWQRVLRRLAGACADLLLLSWVPVVARASFPVLQRAQRYHGTEYVSWVFSREDLLAALTEADLGLAREFILRPQGDVQISGAPEQPRLMAFLAQRRPAGA